MSQLLLLFSSMTPLDVPLAQRLSVRAAFHLQNGQSTVKSRLAGSKTRCWDQSANILQVWSGLNLSLDINFTLAPVVSEAQKTKYHSSDGHASLPIVPDPHIRQGTLVCGCYRRLQHPWCASSINAPIRERRISSLDSPNVSTLPQNSALADSPHLLLANAASPSIDSICFVQRRSPTSRSVRPPHGMRGPELPSRLELSRYLSPLGSVAAAAWLHAAPLYRPPISQVLAFSLFYVIFLQQNVTGNSLGM